MKKEYWMWYVLLLGLISLAGAGSGVVNAADVLPPISTFSWTEVILAVAVVGAITVAAWFVVKHNKTPSSGETLLAQAHTEAAVMHADAIALANKAHDVMSAMVAKATPAAAPAKAAEAVAVVPTAAELAARNFASAEAGFKTAQANFNTNPSSANLAALNTAFSNLSKATIVTG